MTFSSRDSLLPKCAFMPSSQSNGPFIWDSSWFLSPWLSPVHQKRLPGRTLIAIYINDILIQGSSPPQVYLHIQVATLLFMVLGWSLNWEKSVSFPNQQALILALFWTLSLWLLLVLQMGLPDCSLCAGVWRTLSLCMVLSVVLLQ